jgi:hypothetical protein
LRLTGFPIGGASRNELIDRLTATRATEKAIEAIVREIGPEAARLVLSALPRELPFSVELAIRAVERVLDRGLGLGR